MKSVIIFSILIASIFSACSQPEPKQPSKSYDNIKEFLTDAGISDKDVLFFYSGKPRFPIPNVYCFDRGGKLVLSPPQCFQIISDYIQVLNDTLIPEAPGGETLHHFLDSSKIINAYDEVISDEKFPGYDYYLFVDFIAAPLPGMKETLLRAVNAVKSSKKKIKLFLVHAISEQNSALLKSNKGNPDTSKDK